MRLKKGDVIEKDTKSETWRDKPRRKKKTKQKLQKSNKKRHQKCI